MMQNSGAFCEASLIVRISQSRMRPAAGASCCSYSGNAGRQQWASASCVARYEMRVTRYEARAVTRKNLPEQGRNSLVRACMPRLVCTARENIRAGRAQK